MARRSEELSARLLATLEASVCLDGRAFLEGAQWWLADNLSAFGHEERSAYALDDFVSLRLADFPIEYSELDATEELERLRDAPPSSLDGLAMRLRDIIWSGLVLRVRKECPQCGEDDLKALREVETDKLVCACDTCGWAENEDGTEWSSSHKLVPAPTAMLQRRGLLLRSV